MPSVFAPQATANYPHRYAATILVGTLAGGTPADEKRANDWLKTKLGDKDDLIREAVAEAMVERGIDIDAATEVVEANRHLVGFKREEGRGLYMEGRQIKAALKEAASIAAAAGRIEVRGWGKTNKGILGWMAEHVFVLDDRIYLDRTEPTGIAQSFPKGRFGTGIQYTEYVEKAELHFTVVSDHEFTDGQWASIWLTGEHNGIGASRSQGYGRYEVTRWDPIDPPKTKRTRT